MDSQGIYLNATHQSSYRQAYEYRKEVQELRHTVKKMQFITFCQKMDELALASDGPPEVVQDRLFRYLILLKDPCAPYEWCDLRDRRPWDQSPIWPPNILKFNLNKENYVKATIENATLFEKLTKNHYFEKFTDNFFTQELNNIVAPFKNSFAGVHHYATNPQSIHEPIPEVACSQNNISKTRSNLDISYHGVSNSSKRTMQDNLKVKRIEDSQVKGRVDPEQHYGILEEQKGLSQTRMNFFPYITEDKYLQSSSTDMKFSQADKKFRKLNHKLASSKSIFSKNLKIKRLKFKKQIFGKNKFFRIFGNNKNIFSLKMRKIFNKNKNLIIFDALRNYKKIDRFIFFKQPKSLEISRKIDFAISRKIFRLHYIGFRKKRYKFSLNFIRRKNENSYKNIKNTLHFQYKACTKVSRTSTKWLQRKRRKKKINFNHNRRKTFAKVNHIAYDGLNRQQQWQQHTDFTQQEQPSKAVSKILAQNRRIALKANSPCYRIKATLFNQFYLGNSNPVLKLQPRQTEPRIAWLNIIFA